MGSTDLGNLPTHHLASDLAMIDLACFVSLVTLVGSINEGSIIEVVQVTFVEGAWTLLSGESDSSQ